MQKWLIFLVLLIMPLSLLAQEQIPAPGIQSLAVDLWPDYDQESVLVLITGLLPDDADLPATVTVPLHADASLNAVARISSENAMVDDIEYTQSEDAVTLTTPDRRFRVEYYFPYSANGNDRTFTFSWTSGVPVEQFEVSVQQPATAQAINIVPTPGNNIVGTIDNLTYHILPVVSLAANESYQVSVDYTLTVPQLSVNAGAQPQSVPQTAVSPPANTANNNLPIILGISGMVVIVAVLAWALANNQKTMQKPRKPRPRKTAVRRPPPAQTPAAVTAVRFCHECGEPVQAGDKFCRACGTPVRQAE